MSGDIDLAMIRLVASRTLRLVARDFFDSVDLSVRDQSWVDRDSYDAGLVTAAKYLLAQADRLEAAELPDVGSGQS